MRAGGAREQTDARQAGQCKQWARRAHIAGRRGEICAPRARVTYAHRSNTRPRVKCLAGPAGSARPAASARKSPPSHPSSVRPVRARSIWPRGAARIWPARPRPTSAGRPAPLSERRLLIWPADQEAFDPAALGNGTPTSCVGARLANLWGANFFSPLVSANGPAGGPPRAAPRPT